MLDFIVLTPAGRPDPSLAIAASRAGALGLLNLEFAADRAEALGAVERLESLGRGRLGVQVDGGDDATLTALLARADCGLELVAVAGAPEGRIAGLVGAIRARGLRAAVAVGSLDEARAAAAAGADALIVKGHEAGGWVRDETSFILIQQIRSRVDRPLWVQGGVGLHTAAACRVAGVAGVVLDSQLLLTRESPLPAEVRDRVASMDGSEAICLGRGLGAAVRLDGRADLTAVSELRRLEAELLVDGRPIEARREAWRAAVRARVGWHRRDGLTLAVGQDGAFAAALGRRFATVAGVLEAIGRSAEEHCRSARAAAPLDEGSALARSHGTRYPIVQGPMTRVSDRAEFAVEVERAGALPFLALALMRGPEVRELLERTVRLMGDRPWGVGILGFVPLELRTEQLAVVRDFRPPFALIAGGRPEQARALEGDGTASYLHVPSPDLLRMFAEDGARRFVFEGRECGGHVGPRTSFVLWEGMVGVLLDRLAAGGDASSYHVLFAGGIHDGLSAAMVAATAAPLAERGVRVGVLIGTAYLFTEEAVRSGAITDGFQRAALGCERTELLESGPGHATRCAPSPFVETFAREKIRLMKEGLPAAELRHRLEELNIGRLRVASKGMDRNPARSTDPGAPRLVPVGPEEQWAVGMYMIGDVATMRQQTCTLADLHREVSDGSAARLAAVGPAAADEARRPGPTAVAIVGMATILPGAANLEDYWANILDKVDAITEVPATRWDWRRYFDPDRSAPDRIYSRWGGFIDDVPFDPTDFGMPPNTVRSIEPFQLLALAVVREALRDAGYQDRPFRRERTSVILGAGGGGADLTAGYMVRSCLPSLFGEEADPIADRLGPALPGWTEDSFAGLLMNVAAGRVANRFDLGGTNCTIDAACASSLAAVYHAVRELESRASDVAIVGGVDAIQNPFAYLCFSKTQALSPTGRCRTFDAKADGIAISEGFAALVLKRLDDAERDGDRIYAVIRGVGSSSDGRDRSMTAPRPEGQVRALERAYGQAGIAPASVGLVEAHGTGTVAGDLAEVTALSTFFAAAGAEVQGCAIGSVKSMIGHTKATAGVAGLVKVALALHHRVLPPTLGVTEPNPRADFPASPFHVNTEVRPWIQGAAGHPRRAGVSAFGFGGTNFHIVTEEYTGDYLPRRAPALQRWPAELLVFRADSREDLDRAAERVAGALARGARPALTDLAAALAAQAEAAPPGGPTLALVATSLEDLAAKLEVARDLIRSGVDRMHDPRGVHLAAQPLAREGKVAYLFPGQGSQYVGMAGEVALAFGAFQDALERADLALKGRLARPLSRYIYPPPSFGPDEAKARLDELTATDVAQPALGAIDLAYARLLAELGLEPEMAAGHSFGEFVALCAAGCLDERALLHLAEARGRFIREETALESGAMAAVDASPEELAVMAVELGLTLANLNSPHQTVLSGRRDAIERGVEWCRHHGLRARPLPVACAFHSPLVEPARRKLAEELARVALARPRIPVYSNVTAAPYPDDPSAMAGLLADHMVRPVEFVREVEAMYEAGARVFVEVGPRSVLTGLVKRILGDRPHVCAPLDHPMRPGLEPLLRGLAMLASEGAPLRLSRLFEGRTTRRLALSRLEEETGRPTYRSTTWLVNGGSARPASVGDAPPAPEPIRIQLDPPAREPGPAPGLAVPTPSAHGGDGSPSTNGNGSRLGDHPAAGSGPQPDRDLSHPQTPEKGGPMVRPRSRIAPHHEPATAPRWREPAPEPSPIHEPAPPAVLVDRTAQMVGQFQQVMMRFLATQQTVMHDLLAYSGGLGMLPASHENGALGYDPGFDAYPAADAFAPYAEPSPAASEFVGTGNGTAYPAAAPAYEVEHPHPRNGTATNGTATNGAAAEGYASPAPAAYAPAPFAEPAAATAVAPPPPAPSPAPTPAAPEPARVDRAQIEAKLLEVVSDRTGYPVEMLGLDADLEAELSIDSIKRVEIAGTIVRALPVPAGHTADVERLAGSRTLRQVVDILAELLIPQAVGQGNTLPFEEARAGDGVGRFALRAVSTPATDAVAGLARDGVVVLVDDGAGVGAALAGRLRARGHRVVRVVPPGGASAVGDAEAIEASPADPEEAAGLVGRIRAAAGPIAALIDLAALRAGSDAIGLDPAAWRVRLGSELKGLFLLAQAAGPDLERAAEAGGAAILAATALGGSFGCEPAGAASFPGQGARVGFLKTLAHEWAGVRVKAVDLAPAGAGAADATAARLEAELFAADGQVEVGYPDDGRRVGLELSPAPLGAAGADPLPIDRDSVVLITGGARGITAEAALALAQAARPTLLLVGRTAPGSEPEPAETAALDEPQAIRRALIERHRREGVASVPARIEAELQRLLQAREVRQTLEQLRRAGARVEYLTCDVRDPAAFGALIDEVYRTHGRIDGVIHGAGIIEDKLVRDKRPDSFDRVVETKVWAALTLADRLRAESLRFLVFFGSVSGRFGNRGQGDYAAASEILNKLAQDLDRRWPGRVVAINWGPWLKTGMVSPEVQRQFAERGVTLIPPEVGCRMLVEELRFGRKGDVEILIGGAKGPIPGTSAARPAAASNPAGSPVPRRGLPLLNDDERPARDADGGLHLVRRLDPERDLYLRDHCLDDQPVFPFAMAMELMAELAAEGWPELDVVAIRKIRLLRGIVVGWDGTSVRVAARPASGGPTGSDSSRLLDLTIAASDNPQRLFYRAQVELGADPARVRGDEARPLDIPGPLGPAPLSVEAAYRDWLFHGPMFQSILAIEAIGPGGARGLLRPTSPGDTLAGRPQGDWLIDPVVIDSALQMQVLWARLNWDVTLLPAGIQSYRRFAPLSAAPRAIRYELRIRDESRAPLCQADHHFYDQDGRLLGILTDVGGTGSKALNRLSGSHLRQRATARSASADGAKEGR